MIKRQLLALATLLMVGPTIGVPASLWHHHAATDRHAEHDHGGQDGGEPTSSHEGCSLCVLATSPVVSSEITHYFAGLFETGEIHPFVPERLTTHTLDTHPARGPPAAPNL